ncbi:MAG TPA: endonuclease V [Methanoregulaceae archaeon]|nr:endonuclease V [Methanoregulaceae archaeon]HPD09657.1 endonuclease V [Methanoregulaceae archaeon]HRT15691.1 endonuclease V [Methanoregulaceae archaeon]HRU31229.1 endonuclease V [Methanoregulaceae archaeon]
MIHVLKGGGKEHLIAGAQAIQIRMRDRCGCGRGETMPEIRFIGGMDAFYTPGEIGVGVVAVFTFPELEVVEHAVACRHVLFPYVPGLFAFRELPLCLAACEKLSTQPDLLLVNGHGYAHPERFGIACHAGALLAIPTIGVASRPLSGKSAYPDYHRGSSTPLVDGGEQVGMVVRTREGSRPVYVSAGYCTTLPFAVKITLATAREQRLPRPIHSADVLARKLGRDLVSQA